LCFPDFSGRVVAFVWMWSLIRRALVYLVHFLLTLAGPLERIELTAIDAIAGWLNIASFAAAVAAAWPLVSFWRALVSISDKVK
jgi:hypothetical protein